MVREEALQRLEVRRRLQGGARRHVPLRLCIDDGRLGHGPAGRPQTRLLRRAAPPERRARFRAGDRRRVEGRECRRKRHTARGVLRGLQPVLRAAGQRRPIRGAVEGPDVEAGRVRRIRQFRPPQARRQGEGARHRADGGGGAELLDLHDLEGSRGVRGLEDWIGVQGGSRVQRWRRGEGGGAAAKAARAALVKAASARLLRGDVGDQLPRGRLGEVWTLSVSLELDGNRSDFYAVFILVVVTFGPLGK